MFLNADLFLQYRFEFGLIDESFDPSVDIDIRLFEVLENEKKTFLVNHNIFSILYLYFISQM